MLMNFDCIYMIFVDCRYCYSIAHIDFENTNIVQ